jgi:hypothetical protein
MRITQLYPLDMHLEILHQPLRNWKIRLFQWPRMPAERRGALKSPRVIPTWLRTIDRLPTVSSPDVLWLGYPPSAKCLIFFYHLVSTE